MVDNLFPISSSKKDKQQPVTEMDTKNVENSYGIFNANSANGT